MFNVTANQLAILIEMDADEFAVTRRVVVAVGGAVAER